MKTREPKFYIVGGFVRDKILGITSKDIDYSVEASSYADMRRAILDRGGEIFLETPEYFTIRARVPKMGACDFVLCRKDGEYGDGRRPDNVEMGTLYDDLARRDFTMNAIAMDEGGNYIDPFDGMKHMQERVIRSVGVAEDRFNEDALRMLRAIRFSVTKKMMISSEIMVQLDKPELVEKLKNVSLERIREEMLKAFKHDSIATLDLLEISTPIRNAVFNTGLWLKPTLEK